MRVMNVTGIRQRIGGAILPPHVWVSAPECVPVKAAMEAFDYGQRKVNIQVGPEDVTAPDRILWMGPLSLGDGYGTANDTLLWALKRQGVKVYPMACWFKAEDTPLETLKLLEEPCPGIPPVGVCLATPGEFRRLLTPYRIGYTMYEADDPLKSHPEWRHECAQVDRLWVPSDYCRDVFSQFFKGPIDVAELAVNPYYYTALQRLPKETFTFVSYGTLSGRKGPLETIEAWKNAFPKDKYPHVRLELKTRLGICGWGQQQLPQLYDERITVHSGTWDLATLRNWLHQADAFLFLSKGEGYGLPPREALCTGLPTIVSDHTGLSAVAHSKYTYPVPTKTLEESPLGGNWRLPDWDYAIDTMRALVKDPEAAYAKGVQGARWFIREHGAERAACHIKGLLGDLETNSLRNNCEAETPTLFTGTIHGDWYKTLKDIPGTIADIGVGTGLLYVTLARMGKPVYGVVWPWEYEATKKLLEAARVPVNLYGRDLFSLESLPKAAACASQAVLQNYEVEEVRRLLWAQWRLTGDVRVSVPSVNYPKPLAGNLWRLDAWRDVVLARFHADMHYYHKKEHIQGRILGERDSYVSRGRMIDGTWHANQREDD